MRHVAVVNALNMRKKAVHLCRRCHRPERPYRQRYSTGPESWTSSRGEISIELAALDTAVPLLLDGLSFPAPAVFCELQSHHPSVIL